jgi:predicted CxxxxCH...CXXCH cytochrome family protein
MLIAKGQAVAAPQYTMTCTSCHGMPPLDASGGVKDPTTGAVPGSHQAHLATGAQQVACAKCHNNSGYTTSHRNGQIQFAPNINGSPATGAYKKGGVQVTFTNQTSIPSLGSCANVNCHFESATPVWGSSTTVTCNTCHTTPPSDGSHPSITGSGKKHGDYYGTDQTSCVKCHPSHTTFDHATSAGQRGLSIQFVTAPNSGGSYSGNVAYPNYLPSQNPARNGNCANVYCHSNGRLGNPNVSPTWGSTLPTNCNGCHGGDRNSAAFQTMSSGRHTKHIIGQYNYGCAECHALTASNNTSIVDKTKHVNGGVDVSFSSKWGGSFTNSGHAPGDQSGTCVNVYCHSNAQVQPGETQAFRNMTSSKAWFGTTKDSCTFCHSTGSITTGPYVLSGKHLKHLNTTINTTIGTALACNDCHLNGGTNVNRANHVNKFINYSGLKAGNQTTLNVAKGVCSNAYCHSDGKGIFQSMTSANWFSTRSLDCKGCHGGAGSLAGEPAYSNAGSGLPRANTHAKHVGTTAPAATCGNCHWSTTTSGTSIAIGSTTHADSTITLSPGNSKSFSWTANGKTCSSISCHFNGTATWGASLTCADCHNVNSLSGAHKTHMGSLNLSTFSFSSINANLSTGSGQTSPYYYGFGCGNCHPTDNSLHANGTVNVELNNNATLASVLRLKNGTGAQYNYTTHQCDNVYCHSDGFNAPAAANTPSWYGSFANTSDRCANCHGNSPTTGAHSAHVVGIHYDDIFNGTSGKLPAGSTGSSSHGVAAQATTLNCNICHSKTVVTSANDNNTVCKACHFAGSSVASLKGGVYVNDLSFHVNGSVDVVLQNTPIYSKAQMRPASFANYSGVWARNGGNYKNGAAAFDVSKQALVPTMWSAGVPGQGSCSNIACHVGNTVKWNDTLTCESCHTKL